MIEFLEIAPYNKISEEYMKRKKKRLKKQFLFLIILLILIGGYLVFKKENEEKLPKITYKETLTTQVGEEIDLLENVQGLEDPSIKITIEGSYDFNKEGEYSLLIIS